jgi:hypothetical protein
MAAKILTKGPKSILMSTEVIVLVLTSVQVVVQLVTVVILALLAHDVRRAMKLHSMVCRAALVTGAGTMLGKMGSSSRVKRALDSMSSVFFT